MRLGSTRRLALLAVLQISKVKRASKAGRSRTLDLKTRFFGADREKEARGSRVFVSHALLSDARFLQYTLVRGPRELMSFFGYTSILKIPTRPRREETQCTRTQTRNFT